MKVFDYYFLKDLKGLQKTFWETTKSKSIDWFLYEGNTDTWWVNQIVLFDFIRLSIYQTCYLPYNDYISLTLFVLNKTGKKQSSEIKHNKNSYPLRKTNKGNCTISWFSKLFSNDSARTTWWKLDSFGCLVQWLLNILPFKE